MAIKSYKLLGKNLNIEELKIINVARKKEFGSKNLINPLPNNEDWNKIYFIVKDNSNLKAFARLHNIKVTFHGKDYNILGIGSVISIEKRNGYGKILMSAIRSYLFETEQIGLGFCDKNNSNFYIKSGFNIIPDGQNRFHNIIPPEFPNGDLIYYDEKNILIKSLLEYQKEVAEISRPHW